MKPAPLNRNTAFRIYRKECIKNLEIGFLILYIYAAFNKIASCLNLATSGEAVNFFPRRFLPIH
jgi:hypothetical protein